MQNHGLKHFHFISLICLIFCSASDGVNSLSRPRTMTDSRDSRDFRASTEHMEMQPTRRSLNSHPSSSSQAEPTPPSSNHPASNHPTTNHPSSNHPPPGSLGTGASRPGGRGSPVKAQQAWQANVSPTRQRAMQVVYLPIYWYYTNLVTYHSSHATMVMLWTSG